MGQDWIPKLRLWGKGESFEIFKKMNVSPFEKKLKNHDNIFYDCLINFDFVKLNLWGGFLS
jgi:hypothetical protein